MSSGNELLQQINSIYDDVEILMSKVAEIEPKVADSDWSTLTLNEGWTNPYSGAVARYRKIGNVVYLRGLVNATASAGTIIGTLPEGFRANGQFQRFSCTCGQTDAVNIEISIAGNVVDYAKGSQSREFISLYGISFTVN